MLNWWTTVLKLLVDDNATTRHQVSQLISKIMPTRRVGCYTPMFHIFFYTFDRIMSNDYPGLAIVAFFYWSIAFSSKSDHTMDETDVSKSLMYNQLFVLSYLFHLGFQQMH